MTKLKPILSFTDPARVRQMPDDFRTLARHCYLADTSDDTPEVSYRVSWLGDWWFTQLYCKGKAQIITEKGTRPPKDYALIILPLAGLSTPTMTSKALGQSSCITITRWRDIYDFNNSGLTHYLIVHVPCIYLEDDKFNLEQDFCKTISAYHGTGLVLSATLRALANASEHGNKASEQSLIALLPDCARLTRSVLTQPATATNISERATRMERIKEYMEEHFRDPLLSSEEVAKASSLSRRQLYREFKLAGHSFSEALRTLRVEQAAAEIASDKRTTISDIAYRCGFIKISTFNKAFRERYGCAPRVFLRQISAQAG